MAQLIQGKHTTIKCSILFIFNGWESNVTADNSQISLVPRGLWWKSSKYYTLLVVYGGHWFDNPERTLDNDGYCMSPTGPPHSWGRNSQKRNIHSVLWDLKHRGTGLKYWSSGRTWCDSRKNRVALYLCYSMNHTQDRISWGPWGPGLQYWCILVYINQYESLLTKSV